MELKVYQNARYEVVKMPQGYGVREIGNPAAFEAVCSALPFAISYADGRDRARDEAIVHLKIA